MSDDPLGVWQMQMKEKVEPLALLAGGKAWPGSSIHPDWKKNASNAKWMVTDYDAVPGIDIAADLHCLDTSTEHRFDGIFCPYVLEHVERPWDVMKAMAKTLRKEGVLYVLTCQTFPLHYYPNDYFRFSKDALASMAVAAGLRPQAACYARPCKVVPPPETIGWYEPAEAFLDVSICAVQHA